VVVAISSTLTKKSLGQHWLEDVPTLEAIVDLAELKPKDVVLEVGPGQGSMTKLLCARSSEVIAVELDSYLSSRLLGVINADNLSVVNESILKFDLTQLSPSYKLVANIPYYLTSNLLRLLSESSNPPSLIVLLVQKEVAERVSAEPGKMSILSVTTQFYWEVSLKQIVPAKIFVPPPKVDSQVILMKRRNKPLFKDIDEKAFFRLIKIGFSARRKTLLNSMANGLRVDKGLIAETLSLVKIEPSVRPQMLKLSEWYEIYKVCIAKKII
jgi:16S rRNA (adenine1518-N6/adenine1519-N6)-dimethyltransferase